MLQDVHGPVGLQAAMIFILETHAAIQIGKAARPERGISGITTCRSIHAIWRKPGEVAHSCKAL